MALIRPTISELVETIRSDADAILGGVDARLERSLIEVVLLAQSGALHGAYGYLQQIADDVFPDTATAAALERWAAIFGISRGASTFSQGWVGTDDVITGIVPVGAFLRRADGREFQRVDTGILADGSELFTGAAAVAYSALGLPGTGWAVPVRAVRSGAAGNTAVAASLSFVSPISGIPPIVEVLLGLAGAVDSEPDAALRARVLARLQNPPQGGTAAEYEAWALAASTADDPITRAFVRSPASGSNVVTVYVVDDGGGIPAARPPTPTSTAITNARDAIDERRPLSADRNVLAPTFVAITPTIDLTPDTPEGRVAIENEIDSFLIDNHEPGQEVPISILQAVISTAAGGADARWVTPTTNYTPGPTQLLYRGAITWA